MCKNPKNPVLFNYIRTADEDTAKANDTNEPDNILSSKLLEQFYFDP